MPPTKLISGEVRRTIDDRFRITLPADMADAVTGANGETIVAKERFGSLSLWRADDWSEHLASGVNMIEQKIQHGRMDQRWDEVQRLGRLLATRHQTVKLANRSRLLIPDGFREFLNSDPNTEVIIVGAAICVEIWNPAAWVAMLREEMPEFAPLFKKLSS